LRTAGCSCQGGQGEGERTSGRKGLNGEASLARKMRGKQRKDCSSVPEWRLGAPKSRETLMPDVRRPKEVGYCAKKEESYWRGEEEEQKRRLKRCEDAQLARSSQKSNGRAIGTYSTPCLTVPAVLHSHQSTSRRGGCGGVKKRGRRLCTEYSSRIVSSDLHQLSSGRTAGMRVVNKSNPLLFLLLPLLTPQTACTARPSH
jgi:hypothetical protein